MDGDPVIREGLALNRFSSEEEGEATSSVTLPESSNTAWTDEKHNQYLNSMEEEFVNQLYKQFRHSSVSKYKVQRRGRWEEIRFETTPTLTGVVNDSRTLSGSPWTDRLKPVNTGYHVCERSSNDAPAASSSSSSFYRHYFVGNRTNNTGEGSDQNFVDEDGQVENKLNASKETQKCSL